MPTVSNVSLGWTCRRFVAIRVRLISSIPPDSIEVLRFLAGLGFKMGAASQSVGSIHTASIDAIPATSRAKRRIANKVLTDLIGG